MKVHHGHFVKMSYEQLPIELQETVDASNESPSDEDMRHTRSTKVVGDVTSH